MTTNLQEIDQEAFATPGLRFRSTKQRDGRFSIICEGSEGAVELWTYDRFPSNNGGVTLHSPTGRYSANPKPHSRDCHVLHGACWTDGSFAAYGEIFAPLIQSRDSAAVLAELASWHSTHFAARAR